MQNKINILNYDAPLNEIHTQILGKSKYNH